MVRIVFCVRFVHAFFVCVLFSFFLSFFLSFFIDYLFLHDTLSVGDVLYSDVLIATEFSIPNYSRTSMARTYLGPWKFVRDMGNSRH